MPQHQRTQIYLEPGQHAALLQEARRRRLSLAGVIRMLVDEHFARKGRETPGADERRKAALSLIGLGRSGLADVSERADYHLADALGQELARERAAAYGKRPIRRRR